MAQQLNITDLDFDQIKKNLKSYFTRSDSPYRDWNFDGSGLNMMLDVLAYNTHYNAILAHMSINESFIDSAQIRKNVVSHAKLVGYTPTSIRAPRAQLDLVLSNAVDGSLTISKGQQFTAVLDEVTYSFVTDANYTVPNVTGTFSFTSDNNSALTIYEGALRTLSYAADNSTTTQKFVIDDSGADMSTLQVRVRENVNSTGYTTYTPYGTAPYTTLDVLDSTSTVYFLYENLQGKYEVSFGNGIYGKQLGNLNIVELEYISTHGSLANGTSNFTMVNVPTGLSVSSLVATSVASGGSAREGIESIRFNAPISIVTQNRAVTADDYRSLILKDFQDIETINVWGGEDASPPEFGKVFIAIKPNGANALTINQKNEIRNTLKTKKVVTITPEFIDADFTYITLETYFKYNSNLTQYTQSELESVVRNTLKTFNTAELQQFDNVFRYSKLLRSIDSSDPSILNSYARVYVYKNLELKHNLTSYQILNYNSALYVPSTSTESIMSTTTFLLNGATVALADQPIAGNLTLRNVYAYDIVTKVIVLTTVGTLNPSTGVLSLLPINPDSDATVKITMVPLSDDLAPRREQLLSIDVPSCSITGSIDTISVAGAAGVANYTTFPRARQ